MFTQKKPKSMPEQETNLLIKTHLSFTDNEQKPANMHDEYHCHSKEEIINAYEEIKTDIEDIETALNKKIATINISVAGMINNQQVSQALNSFHAFRDLLNTPRYHIFEEIRECGFGGPRR